jgi:hypothetical protein
LAVAEGCRSAAHDLFADSVLSLGQQLGACGRFLVRAELWRTPLMGILPGSRVLALIAAGRRWSRCRR